MSGQKKLTPGASRQAYQRKPGGMSPGAPTPIRTPGPEQRYRVEYGEFPIAATAKIVDLTRQQPTIYLVSPGAAPKISLGMSHLEEFRAVVKTAVTMRDIVDNMIAMEAVEDMDSLTKICDRNRILLERMEIGPFKPSSRSDGYRTLDPEEAAYEKHALAPKDPDAYADWAVKKEERRHAKAKKDEEDWRNPC